MAATRGGHPACIRLLIEKGADINRTDEPQEVKEDEEDPEQLLPVFHNMVYSISFSLIHFNRISSFVVFFLMEHPICIEFSMRMVPKSPNKSRKI